MISKKSLESSDAVSSNPFFVGGPVPPEKFVGRKREIAIAFDQILTRGHLAIWGSGGMGKSSFLHYLASPQTWKDRGLESEFSKNIIVYFNCGSIRPFTPSKFWLEILRKTSNILENQSHGDGDWTSELRDAIAEVLEQQEVDSYDLRQVLNQVLRKIGNQGKFLLLLLDGYSDALYPNQDYTETEMLTFLGEFRQLAVHSQLGENLATIVASSRPLNQLGPQVLLTGSPWFNHYFFCPLKPFEDDEIKELLNKMPSQWALNSKQQEQVRKSTGGHPTLLQNICFLLYQNFKRGRRNIDEQFEQDFLNATQHVFDYTWKSAKPEEQLLLMLIAMLHLEGRLPRGRTFNLSSIGKILTQKERELRDLEAQGLIFRQIEPERDIYQFTSSMMERWVIQEILNNRGEAKLQKLEKTALGFLSRHDLNQINNAVAWLGKERDAVEQIIKTFKLFAGVFA